MLKIAVFPHYLKKECLFLKSTIRMMLNMVILKSWGKITFPPNIPTLGPIPKGPQGSQKQNQIETAYLNCLYEKKAQLLASEHNSRPEADLIP